MTNTTKVPLRTSTYLDSNDTKLFQTLDNTTYTFTRNGTGGTLPLKYLEAGDFEYAFPLGTIAPGEAIKIVYRVEAKNIAFGKITVGLLEKGES